MAQFRTDTKKLDGSNLITRYEVMMLSDKLTPTGTMTDAFSRLRTSQPFTLFDSSHRYQLNSKFANTVSGTATIEHKFHESAVNLNVNSSAGSRAYRESKRVFAYQPGKSMLVINTMKFNEPKTGLRQRVGYFNANNGVYLEMFGSNTYMVLRSQSSGTISERRVLQQDWNINTMANTSYAGQAASSTEWKNGLNLSKANIFWMDLEWLGVGAVRTGFFVDGTMVPAHTFYNDNANDTTYMTTAMLPIRYEIENVNATGSSSTMKQICSSVISEGGYELHGKSRSIGREITNPKTLTTAGTYYPIVSIRLKDSRSDAIALLKEFAFFGRTNNTQYIYQLRIDPVLTSPSWVSAAADSPVEYDFSATAITGGTIAKMGYDNIAAGSGGNVISLTSDQLFAYQLERDPFRSSDRGLIVSLCATGAGNGDLALGAITWEEV